VKFPGRGMQRNAVRGVRDKCENGEKLHPGRNPSMQKTVRAESHNERVV